MLDLAQWHRAQLVVGLEALKCPGMPTISALNFQRTFEADEIGAAGEATAGSAEGAD